MTKCRCDFQTGECQAPIGCKAVAEIERLKARLLLTPTEAKIVADVRANAAVTGDEDLRTPSDLRREQRRLLAIIDRVVNPDEQEGATE